MFGLLYELVQRLVGFETMSVILSRRVEQARARASAPGPAVRDICWVASG